MVFLLFVASLGTIHLILAAEGKRKKSVSRPVMNREAVPEVACLPFTPPETTSHDVYALLNALDQYGRGEQPGTSRPVVPDTAVVKSTRRE